MQVLIDVQTLYTGESRRGIGLATRALVQALVAVAGGLSLWFARREAGGWAFAQAAPGAGGAAIWDGAWQPGDLTEFVRTHSVGVFYATSPLMLDIELPALPPGVRVACQVHDLIPLVLAEHYLHRWPLPLQEAYARRVDFVANADLLLCDSQATAGDVLARLHPKGSTTVTYLGPAAAFGPLEPAAARKLVAEQLGLTGPYILAVSGWDYRKNNPGILAGFAAAGLPDHRLVLAGFHLASPFEELRTVARTYGIAERLLFPPFLAEPLMHAVYAAADLLLFPSLYEGFGLPILEALLCGLPVVTGQTSSLPEVLGPGGLAVDAHNPQAIGEAVRRIALNPALRAEMAERGRAHAAGFTWTAAAQRIAAALCSLASG